MPVLDDSPLVLTGRRLSEFPAPRGAAIGAMFDESLATTPEASVLGAAEVSPLGVDRATWKALVEAAFPLASRPPFQTPGGALRDALRLDEKLGRRLSRQEAQQRIKDAGLEGRLTVDRDDLPETAVNALIARKEAEIRRQDLISRAPRDFVTTTLGLGAGLVAQALSPINIAVGFIPVVGPTRYALMLARAGTFAGRTAARVAVGAVEGAVGAALVEPLVYAGQSAQQADYDMTDSLLNIAFGTVLGGGLHVLAGSIGDALSRTAREAGAPPGGLADRVDALPVAERETLLRTAAAQHVADGAVRLDELATEIGGFRPPILTDAEIRGLDNLHYGNGLLEVAERVGVDVTPGTPRSLTIERIKGRLGLGQSGERPLAGGFVDTRGGPERFHGTSRAIASMDEASYASQNIYGQGFYTTDAVDVAWGYTRKGGAGQDASPTIYAVSEKGAPKMFDMDRHLDADFRGAVMAASDGESPLGVDASFALQDAGSAREWFDLMREAGHPADEVQGLFDAVQHNLAAKGYRGYRHAGGGMTGTRAHDVKVFWFPKEDITLRAIDPATYKVAPRKSPAPSEEDLRRISEPRPYDAEASRAADEAVQQAPQSDGIAAIAADQTTQDMEALVEGLRARGLLTDEDEAALREAADGIAAAERTAEAYRVAAACALGTL